MAVNTTLAGLSQTAASNGPDGSADPPSSLDDAIRYALSFIAQLRDGNGFTAQLGTRNRIINGNFAVNQRAVSGTVTLAAGIYGHDRWKAGASGCTYTFTTSGLDTTITISAGSLVQVIEGLNVEGGTYTMSWSGTAQGKINGGAFAATGVQATGVTAGTNLTVELNVGSISKVQVEPNSTASQFERRPYSSELLACQRYYQTSYQAQAAGTASAASGRLVNFSSSTSAYVAFPIFFSPVLRVAPTLTVYNPTTGASGSVRNESAGTDFASATLGTSTTSQNFAAVTTISAPPANAVMAMHYTASAEL